MKPSDSHSLGAYWRYLIAAAVVVLGFALAYAAAGYLAPGRDSTANAGGTSTGGSCAMGATGSGCRVGSGGGTTAPVSEAAVKAGGVQRLSVAVGSAGYTPDVLQLEAGVPAEITFSQSSGCTAQVISDDLGFNADLTSGPRTVRLPALVAGTYSFSCGMRMVNGSIVVTAAETGP